MVFQKTSGLPASAQTHEEFDSCHSCPYMRKLAKLKVSDSSDPRELSWQGWLPPRNLERWTQSDSQDLLTCSRSHWSRSWNTRWTAGGWVWTSMREAAWGAPYTLLNITSSWVSPGRSQRSKSWRHRRPTQQLPLFSHCPVLLPLGTTPV